MQTNIERIKRNIAMLDVSGEVRSILYELTQEIIDNQYEIKQLIQSINQIEYMQRSNT